MAKWIVLAAGVFLFFNGMFTRTFSYSDGRHCFNMDYLRFAGCSMNAAVPQTIAWGAVLLGAALILWSIWYSRRRA